MFAQRSRRVVLRVLVRIALAGFKWQAWDRTPVLKLDGRLHKRVYIAFVAGMAHPRIPTCVFNMSKAALA